MRTAVVDGVEVEAGPGAPRRAACAVCGERVALWNHTRGGWYYRHVAHAGRDCPLRARAARREQTANPPSLVRGSPELTLAVRITRAAGKDALEGDEEALVWLLEHPLPRMTLEALDIDAEAALARVVERIRGGSQPPYRQAPGRLVGTAIGG
jgi:hypothetical protein